MLAALAGSFIGAWAVTGDSPTMSFNTVFGLHSHFQTRRMLRAKQALARYQLQTTSPYALAGTDGKDLGADVNALAAAIAGVQ